MALAFVSAKCFDEATCRCTVPVDVEHYTERGAPNASTVRGCLKTGKLRHSTVPNPSLRLALCGYLLQYFFK